MDRAENLAVKHNGAPLAIKDIDLQGFNMGALDTAQINTEAIRIRARCIKGFNTAYLAESMFRAAGIKRVSADGIFTAD